MMSNKVSTMYGKRFRRYQPEARIIFLTARRRFQHQGSSSTEIYNIKYIGRRQA